MTGKPIQTGGNGRTPDGRFAVGNRGGPGNPYTKRLQVWRQALAEVVTITDYKAIIAVLVAAAKRGEPWAVKEILDRTLGKAIQPIVSQDDDAERHPVRIVFAMSDGDGQAS